jgi:hypothetical protein
VRSGNPHLADVEIIYGYATGPRSTTFNDSLALYLLDYYGSPNFYKASFDLPHQINSNWIYQLPFGHAK